MKKEKNPDRELWNGFRPSVIPARKKNKHVERKDGKRICQDAKKGEY